MASKLTLTVFAADGVTIESTKEYSRKIDAENAGRKTGSAWTVANGKGAIVSEGAPSAKDAAPAKPAKAAPSAASKPAREKAAKANTTEPGKRSARSGRVNKVGTFGVTGDADQTHKCVGACGEEKPVKAYPTITGRPEVRVAECRSCRDARSKAEKAAKSA